MKRIVSCILIIILCTTLTGCYVIDNKDLINSRKDERLIHANNSFAFDVFKTINSEDVEKNVFISPLSISAALTMTYNGAETTTKKSMEETLEFTGLNRDEVNSGFKYVNEYLNKIDKKIELSIANSIWIREGEIINQDFVDINQDAFDAWIREVDFSKDGAVDEINQWIDASTNGLIKKMLKSPISNDVMMYLINAIYFKGQWTKQFDKNKTIISEFNNGLGEQKPIKMMRMQETIDYMKGEDFKAVKMYYGNKKTAMYCLLPDEDLDINSFIETLDTNRWAQIQEGLTEVEDLVLQIPQFKMEYGIKNLNETLKSLGMSEAFEPNADFSGIREGLFISRVLHKAVIEVNEEGSEAAGVTVVEVKESAMEEPISFIADRPFVFIIADEEMGSILFMGKTFDL